MVAKEILCVGVLLVALCCSTGCLTGNQLPVTYKADLVFNITISNATTGGYLYIPYLLEKDLDLAAGVTQVISGRGQTCNTTKIDTNKGKMFNISLSKKDCYAKGDESIRQPEMRDTENYLQYYWGSPNQTRPTSLPVFVSYPDTNLSVIHTLELKITFIGKSNHCSRTASFSLTLFQNGTWQEVPGLDTATCT